MDKKKPTVMWNKYGHDQVYCHCGKRASALRQRALTGGMVYKCPVNHHFKESEVRRVKTKFDPKSDEVSSHSSHD